MRSIIILNIPHHSDKIIYQFSQIHHVPREPVKCLECQGPHYVKDYPNRKRNFNNVHTIQEEPTIGDVANKMPRINAGLENQQADHQTSMVEIEGMIEKKSLSILIDADASLSYVT